MAVMTRDKYVEPTPAHFYMICNVGTICQSNVAFHYPYHLALAQLWRDSPEYRDAYKKWQAYHTAGNMLMSDVKKHSNLILDNGAHEGELVSDDDYLRAIDQLMPDIVVLPDLIDQHYEASRERSLKFAERLVKVWPLCDFMYAAQGQNQQQILDEYLWAFTNLDPARYMIGFGQAYLQWARPTGEVNSEGPRVQMIKELYAYISNMDGDTKRLRCHILGARWTPYNLKDLWWRFRFTGIDTIKPVTCCMMGTDYPVRKPVLLDGGGCEDYKVDRRSMESVRDDRLSHNSSLFIDYYGLNTVDKMKLTGTSAVTTIRDDSYVQQVSTGRMSCNEPNLSNAPKKGDGTPG